MKNVCSRCMMRLGPIHFGQFLLARRQGSSPIRQLLHTSSQEQSASLTHCLSYPALHSPFHTSSTLQARCGRGKNIFNTMSDVPIKLTKHQHSGLSKALRTSSISRPTAARHAFQPIRKNLAPALGARFASSAGDGKIHQVIGAVVDGMLKNSLNIGNLNSGL